MSDYRKMQSGKTATKSALRKPAPRRLILYVVLGVVWEIFGLPFVELLAIRLTTFTITIIVTFAAFFAPWPVIVYLILQGVKNPRVPQPMTPKAPEVPPSAPAPRAQGSPPPTQTPFEAAVRVIVRQEIEEELRKRGIP